MKNSAIDRTSEIFRADQVSMWRSWSRARRGPRPALPAGRPLARAALVEEASALAEAAVAGASAVVAPVGVAPVAGVPDAVVPVAGAVPVADDGDLPAGCPGPPAAPVEFPPGAGVRWVPVAGTDWVAEAGVDSSEAASCGAAGSPTREPVRAEPCRSLMPVSRSPAALAAAPGPASQPCG